MAKSTVCAFLLYGIAAPSLAQGAVNSTPTKEPKFTSQQIHNYALALLQIQQIQNASAGREPASPPKHIGAPDANVDESIAKVLERRDLTPATFNAISGEVATHRSLRREVRQTMMRKMIGF